ncbi:MAG: hypothetical protein HW421_2454 [Ignavibacteria bacterium]|nr:hypothetical protein [Ignavibacteria bacterium]
MKIISFKCNILSKIHFVICILFCFELAGCYSFTGGTIPEHLKTLSFGAISDNSGFGNPMYREHLTKTIYDKFKRDKSYEIVESNGDARLSISISSIIEATSTVSGSVGRQELETERKVTVNCDLEYYDAVKKNTIMKKNFSNFEVYKIENSQEGRNEAIKKALEHTADDILLAVVSGW